MAQQTFHAKAPNRTPHVATIDGWFVDPDRVDDAGQPAMWSLTLTFRPVLPFADVNDVMKAYAVVDGVLVTNGLDVQQFLLAACTDASRADMLELLDSTEKAVDVETLAGLSMWLIGEYGQISGTAGNPSTR